MKRYPLIFVILFITWVEIVCINASAFGNHISSYANMLNSNRSWRINEINMESYESSIWNNNLKTLNYYGTDNPNRKDSTEVYQYNTDTSSWDLSSTITYTYDSTHEYVVQISQHFTSGEGFPSIMCQQVYNANNYLIESDLFTFVSQTQNMAVSKRIHYIYANNNLAELVTWEPGPGTSSMYNRRTFSYDTRGRIIQEINKTSSDSTNWINNEMIDRVYHPNDTNNGSNFIWNLAHQFSWSEFTANPSWFGMVSSESSQIWFDNSWISGNSFTYTYNTSNQLINYLYQYWSESESIWYNSNSELYTYDANGNLDQLLYQNWDILSSSWIDTNRETYNWELTTGNEDPLAPAPTVLTITAFPNPFQSNLNMIVVSKSKQQVHIEIFNIRGQSVYKTETTPNSQITLDGKQLSSGIYFVKASQDEQTTVRKLLKLH